MFADDGFLLVTIAALVVSTALTFVMIPYMYTYNDVSAGMAAPPANMPRLLILDQRYLDTAAVFTWATLYAVKTICNHRMHVTPH